MAEAWRDNPYFNITSYDEAIFLLDELQKNFLVLGKHIRQAMEEFQESLNGKILNKLKKYGQTIIDAFRVDTVEQYYEAAEIYGAELAGMLYQLSNSFSGLKTSIIQAAAPLVELLVPVVQMAVNALIGLMNTVGYVMRVLFQGEASSESYAQGMQTAVSASKAAQRSLAGFDQINRLNNKTGSSSGSAGYTLPETKPITEFWKNLADKLVELMEPLQKIDLTPLSKSLEKLKKALEPITKALFEALEWAWYNIFVPMAQWAAEELLPTFLELLAAALEALGRVIDELKPAFLWLWENYLKPLAQWKADQLIAYLQGLTNELQGTGVCISGNRNIVDNFIQSGLTMIDTLAQMAEEYLGAADASATLQTAFESIVLGIAWAQTPFANANSALGLLGEAILGIAGNFGILESSSNSTWTALERIWGNAWAFVKENAVDPAYSGFRNTANGIISIINGILKGLTSGLNYFNSSMNKIGFTIPDWVPILGGKGFSFNFPQVSAPQIPLLAKGAVLPANKPFLAVVGDQTRGTNVEAPLSTIQEAVSLVMDDYSRANIAGHSATVELLRQLLNAVLGIQIGDETIAAAVSRYDRKMAVVRGGTV